MLKPKGSVQASAQPVLPQHQCLVLHNLEAPRGIWVHSSAHRAYLQQLLMCMASQSKRHMFSDADLALHAGLGSPRAQLGSRRQDLLKINASQLIVAIDNVHVRLQDKIKF